MQQVPADRVIAELVARIGELSRELAICKVQVQLYSEQQAPEAPAAIQAPPMTTGVPNLNT